MCIAGLSESGHGGRFEPCEECKRLQEENEFTGNRVGLLEAENAALRQDRDRLAGIVMDERNASEILVRDGGYIP